MLQLTLYTRYGCGLCDDMKQAIARLGVRYAFTLDEIDVDQDERLRERFNAKVPVLACDGEILCCHFLDEDGLLAALNESELHEEHT